MGQRQYANELGECSRRRHKGSLIDLTSHFFCLERTTYFPSFYLALFYIFSSNFCLNDLFQWASRDGWRLCRVVSPTFLSPSKKSESELRQILSDSAMKWRVKFKRVQQVGGWTFLTNERVDWPIVDSSRETNGRFVVSSPSRLTLKLFCCGSISNARQHWKPAVNVHLSTIQLVERIIRKKIEKESKQTSATVAAAKQGVNTSSGKMMLR